MNRKHTQTDAVSPAAVLIAKANAAREIALPSPEALDQLRMLIQHNDLQTNTRRRVRAEDAVEMLQGLGWPGKNTKTLDNLCRDQFGRRSYGTP